MKFIFRTDASLQIGTGHVRRCLTLAEALRARGAECIFICREHEGHLIEEIRKKGFECIALTKSSEIDEMHDGALKDLAHADWLGVSWYLDAQQTIQFLGPERVDWLIVDHYALDKRWEEMLRSYVKKILVIDDLADRYHDCDLLLDQNLAADLEVRYQYLLPEHCVTLLGPQYALLQPEYAEMRPRRPPRAGPVKRILVFFGGADQHNITGRAVSAFLKLKLDDIMLDVVVSVHSSHAHEIQTRAQLHANIIVHDTLPTLAPLMLRADLAIGAGGATSWERCCLGLPSLVISIADNQHPTCEALAAVGIIEYFGKLETAFRQDLTEAIGKIINDAEWRSNLARAGMNLTDGLGAQRVIESFAHR